MTWGPNKPFQPGSACTFARAFRLRLVMSGSIQWNLSSVKIGCGDKSSSKRPALASGAVGTAAEFQRWAPS